MPMQHSGDDFQAGTDDIVSGLTRHLSFKRNSRKSGSNDLLGSSSSIRTPSVLFPQTPTPMNDTHAKFFNFSSSKCAGFTLPESAPIASAALEPLELAPPVPMPTPLEQMMVAAMAMQMPPQASWPWMAPPVYSAQLVGPVVTQSSSQRGEHLHPEPAIQDMPSVGSVLHGTGRCQPCAWFWKAGRGCQEGAKCDHCHLCPEGEVKARKKAKLAAMRGGRPVPLPATLNNPQQNL